MNNKKYYLLLTVVLLIVVFVTLVIFMSDGNASKRNVADDQIEQIESMPFPVLYSDTVVVVATHEDHIFKTRKIYKELIFNHNLYMFYVEETCEHHRSYNHPFYAQVGDICVVQIEIENGEKYVTLIENISKKKLAEDDFYCGIYYPDYD